MAAVSGFDPLFAELQNRADGGTESYFVPKALKLKRQVYRVFAKLGLHACKRVLSSEVSPFMGFEPSVMAADCLSILQNNPNDLLMLSVGESQYASVLSNAPKEIRKRIFLCVHQPPAWFKLFWGDFSVLNGLGGIFALCEEQAEFLRAQCDAPVHVIRHGVCLDHFTPSPAAPCENPRFLFVGQWMRDFDTLAEVIPLILRVRPETRFDLVVPSIARYRERNFAALYSMARLPEITWHEGVSPEALLDLYRNCRALLLPLVDATANNAIVEAMACGVAVISTDIGGTREYLSPGAGILCPVEDAQAHADAAIELLQFPEKATRMGEVGRADAETKFSWDRIAAQVHEILLKK